MNVKGEHEGNVKKVVWEQKNGSRSSRNTNEPDPRDYDV